MAGFEKNATLGIRNYYGARKTNAAPANDGYARGNEKCFVFSVKNGVIDAPLGDGGLRIPKGAYVTRVYNGGSAPSAAGSAVWTDAAGSTVLTITAASGGALTATFAGNTTKDVLARDITAAATSGLKVGTGKVTVYYMTDNGNQGLNNVGEP